MVGWNCFASPCWPLCDRVPLATALLFPCFYVFVFTYVPFFSDLLGVSPSCPRCGLFPVTALSASLCLMGRAMEKYVVSLQCGSFLSSAGGCCLILTVQTMQQHFLTSFSHSGR